MRMVYLCAAVVAALLWTGVLWADEKSPPDDAKATPLVTEQKDGQIVGWRSFSEDPNTKTGDVWTLTSEGVLVCKGTPKGYLYTEKSYTNFTLTLEWRSPPGKKPGSGGVLIRMTGEHRIWPKSLEAQLNAGAEGDFWGLVGYAFDGPADKIKRLSHPQFGKLTNLPRGKVELNPAGHWNRYEIVADRGTVTLRINGRQVNRATNCDQDPGPILLTSEGDEIHFRNVKIQSHD